MDTLFAHKLLRVLKYAVITMALAVIFIAFSSAEFIWPHIFYLLVGAWTGIIQEFIIADRLRKLPWGFQVFMQIFLVNILTIGVVLSILYFDLDPEHRGVDLVDGDLLKIIVAPVMLKICLNVLIVTTFAIVFFQLESLIGRYTFPKFVFGRYDKPRREEMVCMFMDIQDSTTIAEKLGDDLYFEFLNETLFLMTKPALKNKAEILKYIGDEVVFTWSKNRGLKNAHCIRIYFDVLAEVEAKKEAFMERYGVAPKFRAGVHCGPVITAIIGHLKRGIDHSGDVMNTTARIAGMCAKLNVEFSTSKDLLDHLEDLPEGITTSSLGIVELKGKEVAKELFELKQKNQGLT